MERKRLVVLKTVLKDYVLPLHGDRGAAHWARVLENGLRLAGLRNCAVILGHLRNRSRRWCDSENTATWLEFRSILHHRQGRQDEAVRDYEARFVFPWIILRQDSDSR